MAKRHKTSDTDDEVSSQEMEVSLHDERIIMAEGIRADIKEYMLNSGKSRINSKSHVSYVVEQIDKLIDLFRHKEEAVPLQAAMENISKKLDQVLNKQTSFPQSYAQVTAPKKTSKPKEVILVEPSKEGDDPEYTKEQLKKKVDPKKIGVGIQAVRKLRKGGIAIELNSVEDKNKLRKEIEEKTGLRTREPAKKRPRLIIYGVAKDTPKEEILDCLYEQNEVLSTGMTMEEYAKEIELKFQFGSREKRTVNWVIEVTPKVRQMLLPRKKINLGWSRCGIEDYINVAQCFKCCKIGHIAKNCPEKDIVCSQCGNNHKYRDCPNKHRVECCNCKREKLREVSHNAFDKKCPLVQKVRRLIIAKIDYGSQ
ncbi:uncharacterized protein LOC111633731 [Centruroides sculpturatus]|uniref:uncharacterized protein LOC111633731 n=1 Tax=Centruroides sculpturatus TaxID=218467 RepID=UPI000C6D5B8F|nr:uncharacterized protein LOC111633731 [Centruroides sculpturatus]